MVPKLRSGSYYANLVFPALHPHVARGLQRAPTTTVLLWSVNLSLPFDFPEFVHSLPVLIIFLPKSSLLASF